MEKKFLHKANLDIIHYANCWEDADVLVKGLSPKPGASVLSIASAGDNAFALLSSDPEKLVAIDLNSEQLYLTELKQIAIKHFEYSDFLQFIGVSACPDRLKMLDLINTDLSSSAQHFWWQNREYIKNGLIYCGKFERYFLLFRKYILPLVHSKRDVKKLFSLKSAGEQEMFYKKSWNTFRWRLLFSVFFSKFVMGRFGRDPEFLKQVEINVEEFIFSRAEKHLSDINCQRNYFLFMIMNGKFGLELPFYLRETNYNQIRSNIGKLELMEGYAQDAVKMGKKFDYLNLSNIFEYMPITVFQETANALYEGIKAGGKIAYWNLMVERKMSALFPEKFRSIAVSPEIKSADMGFFYRDFICDERI
ncbi:MAG: DUF3419 family protein [Chitinophagales bacterium]|nr:DUF3419 family protein [Chitinophagales bacterium]